MYIGVTTLLKVVFGGLLQGCCRKCFGGHLERPCDFVRGGSSHRPVHVGI